MWSRAGWQTKGRVLELRREPLSAVTLSVKPRDTRLLRYFPDTLKTWDINIQEAISKNMLVGVLDRLSRVRLVWNLFDDASPLGKAILSKLSTVI